MLLCLHSIKIEKIIYIKNAANIAINNLYLIYFIT